MGVGEGRGEGKNICTTPIHPLSQSLPNSRPASGSERGLFFSFELRQREQQALRSLVDWHLREHSQLWPSY